MIFCAYGRQLGKGNCVHPFKWYALALYVPGSNKTRFDPVTSTQKQAHFTGLWMQLKLSQEGQNWFGSVDRASACGLRGPGFDSGQGHVPWLRAQPQ